MGMKQWTYPVNLMGIWKVNHKSLMTVTFNINDQIQQENLQEVIKIMFIDDKSATLITNHTSSASGDTLKSHQVTSITVVVALSSKTQKTTNSSEQVKAACQNAK